jgi:hypothetical protein
LPHSRVPLRRVPKEIPEKTRKSLSWCRPRERQYCLQRRYFDGGEHSTPAPMS